MLKLIHDLHIFRNTFSLLSLIFYFLIIMNSQRNSFQHKKIIVLLLMQQIFKKNNRVFNANTHLLTFTQVTSNAAFPYFTHLNLRASQQKRPKTEGFWVDVFPYLTDESGHNSF